MTDTQIVMAVASYPSRAAADNDFRALEAGQGHRRVAVALVEKGADGQLTIDRYHCAPGEPAWEGAVLGSALTVVAAPVGISFLVPVVQTGATLGGVGAIARHFWTNIPKGQLSQMSDLMEGGQAALLVVAGDDSDEEIERRLSGATAKVVVSLVADLSRDFSSGIDEANAIG
jgi:hypothetical protein